MPRIRTIKPGFWRSPDTMQLDYFQRLLYIGLWNLADDEGRGEWNPAAIGADIFLNEYSLNPHGVLTEVSNAGVKYVELGMITLYKHKGRTYFQINAWKEHQRINRPTKSSLPAPTEETTTAHGGLTEHSLNSHGGLTEDSLWEKEKEREGEGEAQNPPTPQPTNLDSLANAHFVKAKAPGVHGTPTDPRCATHAKTHPAGTTPPPCRACAQARQWFETNTQHQAEQQRAERRAAITACDQCDDNGFRTIPGGVERCNHQPKLRAVGDHP